MELSRTLLIVLIGFLISACSEPNKVRAFLEENEYTEIRMGGYDLGSCESKHIYAQQFTATNRFGGRVKGIVCADIEFKEPLIRLR